jgi:hypothetical protein
MIHTYSIPNLLVVYIVGGPSSDDYGSNCALHHTIGLPDFSQELWCFQMVTCYPAFIHNLDDAHERIGTSIATTLRVHGMRVADTPMRAGLGRHARLASTAAVLKACDPDEAVVEAGLQSAFPEPPSEQDTVIMLNMATATRPEIAVLALRWFLGNVEVWKKVIIYKVKLKLLRKKRHWRETEALWAKMLRHGMQPGNTIFSTIISCVRLRPPEQGCRVVRQDAGVWVLTGLAHILCGDRHVHPHWELRGSPLSRSRGEMAAGPCALLYSEQGPLNQWQLQRCTQRIRGNEGNWCEAKPGHVQHNVGCHGPCVATLGGEDHPQGDG